MSKIENLNKYFKPIKSYFAARYIFYQAKQRQDESVCQCSARVKNLLLQNAVFRRN